MHLHIRKPDRAHCRCIKFSQNNKLEIYWKQYGNNFMGFFQTCRYKYRSNLQRVFKFASSCFKNNLKINHFITVQRTSLGDSRFGLFSPTTTLLTVDHARLWEKFNFESITQIRSEIFRALSIQKTLPPAGIKHIGAVCRPALWKSGLFKDSCTLKLEMY